MRPEVRREPGGHRVPEHSRARRPGSGALLGLLALTTVCLLASARDFTHEPTRRQRILVHLDRELATLDARPDPAHRRRLEAELIAEPLLFRHRLTSGMWVAGVMEGSWTHGTRRAAVIVANDGSSPRAAALQFVSAAPPAALPQKVLIEGALTTHEVRFAAPGSIYFELPALAPRSQKLFGVWTDRFWFPADSTLARGIRIQAGNLVLHRLRELRRNRDARRWREVTEELAADAYLARLALDGPRLAALNLTPDQWTHGTDPAALLAENTGTEPYAPRVKLRGPERAEVYPLTVSIDNGTRIRRLRLAAPRALTARLGRVRPGSRRLFLLWTDRSWATAGDSRTLGVRVRSRLPAPPQRDQQGP